MNNHITRTMLPILAMAVSTSLVKADNYVKTSQMLDTSGGSSIISIQYYDGLGRPVETISGGQNTVGAFLNSVSCYDALDNVSRTWLPVAQSDSSFMALGSIPSLSSVTYRGDTHAYCDCTYDVAGRILRTSMPGNGCTNKGVTMEYTTNQPADSVKKYAINNLTAPPYYAAGALKCETVIDEDSLRSQTFTDIRGLVILERKGTQPHIDTYYVYNDLGQLRYVLSPMYQEEADLQKYAYQYDYDTRGRRTRSTIPGCEYVQMGYNMADQMVYVQDCILRGVSKSRFMLYDTFGRLAVQGTCSNIPTGLSSTITTMQYANGSAGYLSTGYSRSTNPSLSGASVELVNYYDGYSFLQLYSSALGSSVISQMTLANPNGAKGRKTGMMQKASDGETLLEAYYYDAEGRVITTFILGLKKNLTRINTSYNFVGDVINEKKEYYTWTGSALSKILTAESTKSYYDNTRLQKRTILKMTDSSNHVIRDTMRFEYDSLGHVSSLNRYGNAADMNYQYDLVHGWLTAITSEGGFAQHLIRESHSTNPLYNGNIAAMTWAIPDDSYERRYDYTYDELSRLIEGHYSHYPTILPHPGIIQSTGDSPLSLGEPSGEAMPIDLIPVTGNGIGDLINPFAADRYTERIAYDRNSNISGIERYGMNNLHQYGLIDSLVITRNGNQLKTIEDYAVKQLTYTGASDFFDGYTYNNEYYYNANGALESDINRDIDLIQYDDLGNTRCIYYFEHDQIEYIYAADGTKLRTIHRPVASSALTDSTDYMGNLIFKNGQPSMYLFDGGYASYNSNGALSSSGMHYYIQDYLGNNRMVVNRNGTVEQVTHYYPYGGVIGDISTNENVQKYKFEGKELDRTFGLDNYDIQARQYFAMMPSWDRIDPLAENDYRISPYTYCGGNPIILGDYNGKRMILINGLCNGSEAGTAAYWPSSFTYIAKNKYDEVLTNEDFIDGSMGGYKALFNKNTNRIVNNRVEAGYNYGLKNAKSIIDGLKKQDGKIIEPLIIVSHSMGGAFAMGLTKAILEYINSHPNECEGLVFTNHCFAPYQSENLTVPYGAEVYQYSHFADMIARTDCIEGAKQVSNVMKRGEGIGHTIYDFLYSFQHLESGKYEYRNGEWVKIQ